MLKSILIVLALSVTASAQIPEILRVEQKTRQELNRYAFRRDVVLQTIGTNGEVNGEIVRTSMIVFDDRGNRAEKILDQHGELKGLKITKEDWADLRDAQLLGIDNPEKYDLAQDEGAITVTPKVQPDPKRMSDRYFIGKLWADQVGRIVKVRGVVEPSGKQRFARFTTIRADVGNGYLFPVSTEADDVLFFPDSSVHYRIQVRYYDYKRFGSTLEIKELEPVPAISTRVDEGSPVVAYPRYPRGSTVKVYIEPRQFNLEQQMAIQDALFKWNRVGLVKLELTNEASPWHLTIERRDIASVDHDHFAYFLGRAAVGEIVGGSIQLDVRTVSPEAVGSFVAHELGHAVGGLSDCSHCKSAMKGFPGPNKGNGYSGPTEVDIKAVTAP